MKKVVIVGCGFGGLNAAKTLGGRKDVEVTVIDRRNHHLFQPLLYQVAMAGLSPAEIAAPIRSLLSEYKNINVVLGNVSDIDLTNKRVSTEDNTFEFDYLILACGAKHSYFGHEDWEERAPGLKTVEQATEIRRRVLTAYELAEKEKDSEKQKQLLTFVVVGGGPTGVELAGALGEISHYTISKDFRKIDPVKTRIILVEAGERVLSSFTEYLSERTQKTLNTLGVEVRTQSRVTQITSEGVFIGEEFIPAHTVLWAAGVKPSSLSQKLPTEKDKQGRVIVKEDLSIKEDKNIFVIGDQAHFIQEGKPLPGLAPVAMQQGQKVAQNILKDLKNKPREKFVYYDKGQMATIGRKRAVMMMGRFQSYGFFAWLMWLFVHVYYLVGFRNKVFVILQWAWNYFTYKRGARLIVSKEWRSHQVPSPFSANTKEMGPH